MPTVKGKIDAYEYRDNTAMSQVCRSLVIKATCGQLFEANRGFFPVLV
jgi:hypothetical protein